MEDALSMFSLEGKVSIVTGGATGMGQAFADLLSKLGSDIVITSHRNKGVDTKEIVEKNGREILVVDGVDICNPDDRKRVIDQTLENFGKIDVLVNNAGIIKRAPVLEHSNEDWQEVIDTNISSVFYLSKDVANIMSENGGGKIINIASMLSYQGGKFVPGYTSSKHAIVGLTKSFCNELSIKNIQVNAVAPGYVKTNNTKPILENEARYEEITSRIPIGKWAEPSDIAGAVAFLASSASDYINGATIPVDGGWLSN